MSFDSNSRDKLKELEQNQDRAERKRRRLEGDSSATIDDIRNARLEEARANENLDKARNIISAQENGPTFALIFIIILPLAIFWCFASTILQWDYDCILNLLYLNKSFPSTLLSLYYLIFIALPLTMIFLIGFIPAFLFFIVLFFVNGFLWQALGIIGVLIFLWMVLKHLYIPLATVWLPLVFLKWLTGTAIKILKIKKEPPTIKQIAITGYCVIPALFLLFFLFTNYTLWGSLKETFKPQRGKIIRYYFQKLNCRIFKMPPPPPEKYGLSRITLAPLEPFHSPASAKKAAEKEDEKRRVSLQERIKFLKDTRKISAHYLIAKTDIPSSYSTDYTFERCSSKSPSKIFEILDLYFDLDGKILLKLKNISKKNIYAAAFCFTTKIRNKYYSWNPIDRRPWKPGEVKIICGSRRLAEHSEMLMEKKAEYSEIASLAGVCIANSPHPSEYEMPEIPPKQLFGTIYSGADYKKLQEQLNAFQPRMGAVDGNRVLQTPAGIPVIRYFFRKKILSIFFGIEDNKVWKVQLDYPEGTPKEEILDFISRNWGTAIPKTVSAPRELQWKKEIFSAEAIFQGYEIFSKGVRISFNETLKAEEILDATAIRITPEGRDNHIPPYFLEFFKTVSKEEHSLCFVDPEREKIFYQRFQLRTVADQDHGVLVGRLMLSMDK